MFGSMKKKTLAMLTCALLVLTTACSTGGNDANSEGNAGGDEKGSVDILWWSFDSDSEERDAPDVYKDIFNDYNKEFGTNYNMTYEYIPFEDYSGSKLMTAFAAGSGPDIYMLCPPYLPNYVNAGSVLPLTDYYTEDMLKDFSEGMIQNATMGGEIYTIPLHMDLLALWYDAKLFEAEGVKVPETWDEMVDAAVKLNKDGRYGMTLRIINDDAGWRTFDFYPFVWSAGGDIFDAEAKKSLFDSPEVLSALELYKEMADAGVLNINPSRSEDDLGILCEGETAMQITGSWACSTYEDYLEDGYDIELGVVPFPVPDVGGSPATAAGGWSVAINSKTKHPQEVTDVMFWGFAKETKYLVERYGDISFAYPTRDSVLQAAGDIYTEGLRSVFTNEIFGTEHGELRLPAEGLQYVADAIQSVSYGGDAEEAQKTAHEGLQTFLNEFDGLI